MDVIFDFEPALVFVSLADIFDSCTGDVNSDLTNNVDDLTSNFDDHYTSSLSAIHTKWQWLSVH